MDYRERKYYLITIMTVFATVNNYNMIISYLKKKVPKLKIHTKKNNTYIGYSDILLSCANEYNDVLLHEITMISRYWCAMVDIKQLTKDVLGQ